MTLHPGARARLEGPFGAFVRHGDPARPQTWIAGGIGITPFLSWARSLSDIATVNPNLSRGEIFICGPPALVDNLTTGLVASGIPPYRIHSETFDFR